MKKLIAATLILSFFFSQTAFAFYYDAKCLVPQGKFKKCYLDFSKSNTLIVRYKDFEYSNGSKETDSIMFGVSKKKGMMVADQLQSISGKDVGYPGFQAKK